jgi:hypothetical protein
MTIGKNKSCQKEKNKRTLSHEVRKDQRENPQHKMRKEFRKKSKKV